MCVLRWPKTTRLDDISISGTKPKESVVVCRYHLLEAPAPLATASRKRHRPDNQKQPAVLVAAF